MPRKRKKRRVWYTGKDYAIRELNRRMKKPGVSGGIPKGVRINVRKGFKILNRRFNRYDNVPEYIDNHKVVELVQIYWDDDADGDIFKPLVERRRRQSPVTRIIRKIKKFLF